MSAELVSGLNHKERILPDWESNKRFLVSQSNLLPTAQGGRTSSLWIVPSVPPEHLNFSLQF